MGVKRREFQAQVTLDYLEGKARRAERVFGWSRRTVELGLNELRTGIKCLDNFSSRGNKKSEEKKPQLEKDICSLAEPESQVDPKFQSPFKYTRMTAKAMRQALIEKKGWKGVLIRYDGFSSCCNGIMSLLPFQVKINLERLPQCGAQRFPSVAKTSRLSQPSQCENRLATRFTP